MKAYFMLQPLRLWNKIDFLSPKKYEHAFEQLGASLPKPVVVGLID